ncbi:MAG TPA: EAL domain-containing protein [Usitatibacter sp.]|nr:EAL domain-containing protein [Usitatibacter sp.]
MRKADREVSALLAALGSGELSGQLEVAQQLIEALPVPVFLKARDGTYLRVNGAWEEFFGVAREAMIGRSAADLYSHAPEIAARHQEMDRVLWAEPGSQSYEIALPLRDGRTRHTLFSKATFTDSSGQVHGLIGTIVDITDRKRAEQREAIEHAAARYLGGSESIHDAVRGILRVMCERLDWACAARWSLDERDNRLHSIETWSIDDERIRAFLTVSAQSTYAPDRRGFIRQVLATGISVWLPDASREPAFLRAPHAERAGLKGAVAFPILLGEQVLGVIELYSAQRREPDPWLQQTAMNIGRLIGQLMARREAEAATRQSEERFRGLTELSSDWYWEQDEDLRFTLMSGGVRDSLRVEPGSYLGKRRWEVEMVGVTPESLQAHQARVEAREPFQDFEFGRRDADGRVRHVSVSGRPIFDEAGSFRGYRGVGKDITQRKLDEEALRATNAQLERQANFDALTGLPNRHLLNDRLKQAVFAQRTPKSVAVVFLDLDHFKVINDSLGHNVGDEVLRQVGERLLAAVREGDTVARVGGDEFVLLLNDQSREDVIFRSMRRIIATVGEPISVAGRDLKITCSAGISLYPQDGPDVQTLLKYADAAMYRAKSQGRNTFQFFTAEMNDLANERLSMEQSLRRALDRGELLLHYQPRVNLRTGNVHAVEALLRWQHPERGLVLPDRFIPLAEETGLIVQIGEWVLQEACAEAARWSRAGLPPVTMSVNLSARQLWGTGLVRRVGEIAHANGMSGRLELELTESMVMHDADTVVSVLEAFRAIGVRTSLDDFGTGYSSLSYLRRLPISALKIDGSFIRDILATGGADDGVLAKAIISLGHSLHLNVVAEGVETREQRDFLEAHGCDEIQGYFHSRPLPPEECAAHLKAFSRH